MTDGALVHPAIQGCVECCRRSELVLDTVSDEKFRRLDESGQSIGAHLRHGLDHMVCFVRGIESGVIRYNERDRDIAIEQSPGAFRQALRSVSAKIQAVPAQRLGDTVSITDVAAPESGPVTVSSTLERELMFLSSHMIHHLAVIEHMCRKAGLELPNDFSLAYSTATYRAANAG